MTQMWGADADALDALARQMATAAAHLDTISRRISSQLAGSPWSGADADRFRANWSNRHRAGLRAAADSLVHADRMLTSSAADQRRASDHGGGRLGGVGATAVTGSAFGRLAATTWGTARGTAQEWQAWTAPLAGLGVLASAASTAGRYTNAYRPLAQFNDLFRYKQSPILQRLSGLGGPLGHVLDNPVFATVSTGAGLIGAGALAVDNVRVLSDFADGRADRGDVVRAGADTAATALKASKNPVSYLAGVNVSIWSDVVEEGQKALKSGDFTLRGLPSPFSRESFTEVYLQTAKDVAGQLGSMWKKWF